MKCIHGRANCGTCKVTGQEPKPIQSVGKGDGSYWALRQTFEIERWKIAELVRTPNDQNPRS